MDYKDKLRQIPLGLAAGLATLVLASGGSVAWLTWRTLSPVPPAAEAPPLEVSPQQPSQADPPQTAPIDAVPPEVAQQDPANPAPAAEKTGQIFWLKDHDGRLQLVPETITVAGDASPEAQVAGAFEALLAQAENTDQGAFTTIPDQTQLLNARVEADGIHVDLSAAFTSGGGSASMTGRLAQVIYTATAFDPTAPVWISVEGEALTRLGGEGLEVSQPMTRNDFNQSFDL
ncbi:MAG: GerMN domain-containing protein [Leptolyngbya sp.]|nr:GerMN domain-containing protein [Leptolyngbya sp.]